MCMEYAKIRQFSRVVTFRRSLRNDLTFGKLQGRRKNLRSEEYYIYEGYGSYPNIDNTGEIF
jgi:hypothetical protein